MQQRSSFRDTEHAHPIKTLLFVQICLLFKEKGTGIRRWLPCIRTHSHQRIDHRPFPITCKHISRKLSHFRLSSLVPRNRVASCRIQNASNHLLGACRMWLPCPRTHLHQRIDHSPIPITCIGAGRIWEPCPRTHSHQCINRWRRRLHAPGVDRDGGGPQPRQRQQQWRQP